MCSFAQNGPDRRLVRGFISKDQATQVGFRFRGYIFGCANEAHNFRNEGGLFAGAISLSNGTPTSLVAQLAARGLTQFSYCLVGGSETKSRRQGFLRFSHGNVRQLGPRIKTTKILSALGGGAHGSEYYHLGLIGVSLGARRLEGIRPEMFARDSKDGEGGGCVIDVATLMTVMVQEAYNTVEEAVWSDLERRHGVERVKHASFCLCFRVTEEAVRGHLQSLSLHFSEDDAVMVFSPEQLFLVMHDERGQIACLAMVPGHRTVTGALQQVDTRFLYDVKENKLSFASKSCIEDTAAQVDLE